MILTRQHLGVKTVCLQQDPKEGASPLVVGGLIAPQVGLIGGPVNGVQLTPQAALQALEGLPPFQHHRTC